jgi:perosamine synthetase
MTDDTPAKYGGEPIREDVLGYGGQSISETEKQAVLESLEGGYITRGPTVDEFEERVAEFVGVDHAIATTSGTTALHLAGRTADFDSGDEVITTPLTFVSTAHACQIRGRTNP